MFALIGVMQEIETAPYTALRLPQGEGKDILQFDRADLLEAIAASRLFADHMKDVALDMCTVHVFIAEAEDEPPPGVEPTVLKGVMQLGSIAGAHSGNIFVHVDLPHQAPASGALTRSAGTWDDFIAHLKKHGSRDADTDIYRFFRNIQTAECKSVGALGSQSALLDVQTHVFGDITRGTKIFVRASYEQLLLDIMTEMTADVRRRGFVVTGTPGTGKSLFASYLVYYFTRVHSPQQAVLYEYSLSDSSRLQGVVLYKGGVYELERPEHFATARRLPVIYICDAVAPYEAGHSQSFTILVTSPKRERYKEWIKQHSIVPRYMPLWSLEELHQCAAACGIPVTIEVLTQRFDRWGGVARAVLQDLAQTDQQNVSRLQQAVQDADAETAFRAITRLNVIECDRVIHMHVPVNSDGQWVLTEFTEVFASPIIAQRMQAKLFRHDAIAALRIVEQAQTAPQLRGLAGYMFEPLVIRRFAAGGQFLLRPLSEGMERLEHQAKASRTTNESASDAHTAAANEKWDMDLPPLHEKLYPAGALSVALAACRDGAHVLIPEVPNEPFLDFVVAAINKPLLAVQVTASSDHGVSMSGLTAFADCVPEGDIHLVFAVPKALAGQFQWQTLQTKSGSVWKGALDSKQNLAVARLKQWVVGISSVLTDDDTRALQARFAV